MFASWPVQRAVATAMPQLSPTRLRGCPNRSESMLEQLRILDVSIQESSIYTVMCMGIVCLSVSVCVCVCECMSVCVCTCIMLALFPGPSVHG